MGDVDILKRYLLAVASQAARWLWAKTPSWKKKEPQAGVLGWALLTLAVLAAMHGSWAAVVVLVALGVLIPGLKDLRVILIDGAAKWLDWTPESDEIE